jgi:hypothetical protein
MKRNEREGKGHLSCPVFGNKGLMTIYTGAKTSFHPPHWPITGDWVRVRYIIDREGYYRAYDVYID